MNFGIIYSEKNNSTYVKYTHTANDAYIAAYNHMILNPNIFQATIFDMASNRVLKVYSR